MNPREIGQHFVFVRSDLQYALPVLSVLEIVEAQPLLPSHGAMPGWLGNVAHRDHLLPVFDPAPLCGVGRRESDTQLARTFVLVSHEGAVFGLAMDRFVTVTALDVPSTPPSQGGDPTLSFAETVRAFRDTTLIVLRISALAALVKRHFGNQSLRAERDQPSAERPEELPAESIFLCARIEQILFAIPVEQVVEVIEGYAVTPLYKVPPMLRGLINLRGQVLACIDISGELGLPARHLEERNQFVVLQQESFLALCVDRVTGIRTLSRRRIQRAEGPLCGVMTLYTSGVIEESDGPVFLLSTQAVFDAPPLLAFQQHEG